MKNVYCFICRNWRFFSHIWESAGHPKEFLFPCFWQIIQGTFFFFLNWCSFAPPSGHYLNCQVCLFLEALSALRPNLQGGSATENWTKAASVPCCYSECIRLSLSAMTLPSVTCSGANAGTASIFGTTGRCFTMQEDAWSQNILYMNPNTWEESERRREGEGNQEMNAVLVSYQQRWKQGNIG